ncbi:MAG TPA: diacylglycerol kinase family protein [Gemmatimonadales bacterium]
MNPDSGSAGAARTALERAAGFEVRLARAAVLGDAIAAEVAAGTPRVLVAGGDGTIARAASALAGTALELAVLPGGTLNHFARDQGIPSDPEQALAVAAAGRVRSADVGYVNGELFLNTSSIGAYVRYVRTRDRIERVVGYWLGSLAAGLRVLLDLQPITVALAVGGATQVHRAPLVFVAVGERRLGLPGLGQRVPDGARALHVVLPRGRRQARRFARAYARLDRGLPVAARALGVDAALVDRFGLVLGGGGTEVAVDGEIQQLPGRLDYRFSPGAIRVVTPADPAVS